MSSKKRSIDRGLLENTPLVFCTYRAYALWCEKERTIAKALGRDPSRTEVGDALTYFRVSRSFAGIRDENRQYTAVVDEIRRKLRDAKASKSRPGEEVMALAEDLKSVGAGKRNHQKKTSAASKLLWFCNQKRYIIYDQRAWRTLKTKLGYNKLRERDYAAYFDAWETSFKRYRDEIDKGMKLYQNHASLYPRVCDAGVLIEKLAEQRWFQKRVFDIFLYELGG